MQACGLLHGQASYASVALDTTLSAVSVLVQPVILRSAATNNPSSAPWIDRTQLAMPLPPCEYSYAFPRRRYRLRVRTRPSQGRNPGSNPGIATNSLLFFSAC